MRSEIYAQAILAVVMFAAAWWIWGIQPACFYGAGAFGVLGVWWLSARRAGA